MKPTKAQADVLRLMDEHGAHLVFRLEYGYARGWVVQRSGMASRWVKATTARAIIRRPWVEQKGAWHLLTDAGREAIR